MPKAKESKRRFTDTRRVGTDLAYLNQWRKHRSGEAEIPEHEEVEIVEVDAIQDGERVKISVYADQVEDYKRVLRDAEERAAAEEEESE